MSIKLLPASVDPVDPSQARDVSTSLVPLTQRAITTHGSQTGPVTSADTFTWSSSTRRSAPNVIDATPVEDSDIDETQLPGAEYVSGWAWSRPIEATAVAHYLFYAVGPAAWNGRLISVYA